MQIPRALSTFVNRQSCRLRSALSGHLKSDAQSTVRCDGIGGGHVRHAAIILGLFHGGAKGLDPSGFALDDNVWTAIPEHDDINAIRVPFSRHLHMPLDFNAINPDSVRPDQFMKAPLPNVFLRVVPFLVFGPSLADLALEKPSGFGDGVICCGCHIAAFILKTKMCLSLCCHESNP